MNPGEHKDFQDPALKAAVRRAYAGPAAPAHLRAVVERAMTAESAVASSPRMIFGFQPRKFALAVAAMFLILIPTWIYLYKDYFDTAPQPVQFAATIVPAVANDMIVTHDFCCSKPDHHNLKGVPDDYNAIRVALSSKLGIPTLSAAPEGDWKFHGAGPCPVGQQTSSHLVFSKGNQKLSIFSLPFASSCTSAGYGPKPTPATYDIALADHYLSGFSQGPGLYCVVGSSSDNSMTPKEIEAIRTKLMDEFLKATASGKPMTDEEFRKIAIASLN